jgi:hypothetical protein
MMRQLFLLIVIRKYIYFNFKQRILDYFSWYHYAISRRQAEHVLESRPSGSFLVRQSESGNQNDYSLSIK